MTENFIADKIGPTMAVLRQDVFKNIQVSNSAFALSGVVLFMIKINFMGNLYLPQHKLGLTII